MKAKITIAKSPDYKVKHVSEVSNGLKCNCFCIQCGQPLVAANNGQIQEHHFRHHTDTKCDGAPETALHLLAKRIVIESPQILIEKGKYFAYHSSRVEETIQDIKPDVQIFGEHGSVWLVEIAVTNPVDNLKLNKLKSKSLNCLEIRLTDVDRNINIENLKELILNDVKIRKILTRGQPNGATINRSKSSTSWVLWLIGIVLALLLRKKRRRR